LKKIIKAGENQTVEFKHSGVLANPFELAQQLTALANTDGGRLLIGVRDDNTIEGMTERKGHQEHIANVARQNCDPPIQFGFEVVSCADNQVVYLIKVAKAQDIIYGVKEKAGIAFYIRVGSTVRSMSGFEIIQRARGSKVSTLTSDLPARPDAIFAKQPYRRVFIRPEQLVRELVSPSWENDSWLYESVPKGLCFPEPHPRQHGVIFQFDDENQFYGEVTRFGELYYGEQIPGQDEVNIIRTISVYKKMLRYAAEVYRKFPYEDPLLCEFKLGNVKGQELTVADLMTRILLLRKRRFIAIDDNILISRKMTTKELAAPDQLALSVLKELCRAFGFAVDKAAMDLLEGDEIM
jgi:hypothetical protein